MSRHGEINPDFKPLEIIGHIAIPRAAKEHRFYREAFMVARALGKDAGRYEKVIGTINDRKCELYGWGANVDAHTDDSGYIYICLMSAADSLILVEPSLDDPQEHSALMQIGTVVRLNDFRRHWTYDGEGSRVCAFVGSFSEPDDVAAMTILTEGIATLARGDYYGAPRVRDGFRVMLSDECFALPEFDSGRPELMLKADAEAKGLLIIPCAKCGEPASKLDAHFPYDWTYCLCSKHRETPENAD